MNRYWDLTEQQRAQLTHENVEAFLDVELMEKGVLRVEQPELQPIQETKLPTRQFYAISRKGDYSDQDTQLLFSTIEDANAFISLAPWFRDSKYVPHPAPNIDFGLPGENLKIHHVNLPVESDIASHKSVIESNAAAKKANEDALKKHAEACKAVDDAVQGVWSDWQECQSKQRAAERVLATKQNYIDLCKGDQEIAATFLAKVYSPKQIAASEAWFAGEPVEAGILTEE